MNGPPTVAAPPPQAQPDGHFSNSYGYGGGRKGGRGGRGRGGRGRGGGRGGLSNYGRGNYGQQYQPSAMQQNQAPATVPQVGGIPPPPGLQHGQHQRARSNKPNPVKYYNNWNMCYNCGYDVPIWHTSQSCPYKQECPHHNDGINHGNANQYEAMGWKISTKGIHKTQLPTNLQQYQA